VAFTRQHTLGHNNNKSLCPKLSETLAIHNILVPFNFLEIRRRSQSAASKMMNCRLCYNFDAIIGGVVRTFDDLGLDLGMEIKTHLCSQWPQHEYFNIFFSKI
jgi:hypothetical protein